MNNWRDLFQDHILARGEMYYYDGAVLELHKTEHGYQAIVEGTEDYEVEIEIEEGEVCEMYCSCPYAEDGSHCKHMAAVLYEIEEQDESGRLSCMRLRNRMSRGSCQRMPAWSSRKRNWRS